MSERSPSYGPKAERLQAQLCSLINEITRACIEGTDGGNLKVWTRTLAGYIEDVGGYAETMELDPSLYTVREDLTDRIDRVKRKRVRAAPSADAEGRTVPSADQQKK